MSVIYVLLAISISVAILFFTVFIISVRKGQYDDAYTPSVRMLFEDEIIGVSTKKNNENTSKYTSDKADTYLKKPLIQIRRKVKTNESRLSSENQ